MLIEYREPLLSKHRAIWETESEDFTLSTFGPGAQVPNSGGQSVERLRAFPAQEMQALVLVGSQDLVTHRELQCAPWELRSHHCETLPARQGANSKS